MDEKHSELMSFAASEAAELLNYAMNSGPDTDAIADKDNPICFMVIIADMREDSPNEGLVTVAGNMDKESAHGLLQKMLEADMTLARRGDGRGMH